MSSQSVAQDLRTMRKCSSAPYFRMSPLFAWHPPSPPQCSGFGVQSLDLGLAKASKLTIDQIAEHCTRNSIQIDPMHQILFDSTCNVWFLEGPSHHQLLEGHVFGDLPSAKGSLIGASCESSICQILSLIASTLLSSTLCEWCFCCFLTS